MKKLMTVGSGNYYVGNGNERRTKKGEGDSMNSMTLLSINNINNNGNNNLDRS